MAAEAPPVYDITTRPWALLNRDELVLEEAEFGRGQNGKVLKGKFRGRNVAVKLLFALDSEWVTRIHFDGVLSPEEKTYNLSLWTRECDVLYAVQSPYVMTIFGVVLNAEREPCEMIMEALIPFESDAGIYHNKQPLSRIAWSHVGYEVALGLEFLESQKVVHRDLKPPNLLVTPDMHVKIGDFGTARFFGDLQARRTTGVGSPVYTAPDRKRGDPVSPAMDCFSFGVMMMELATGADPSPDRCEHTSDGRVIPEVVRREEDIRRLTERFSHAVDIIKRCLHDVPAGRAQSLELKQFFEESNPDDWQHTLHHHADGVLTSLEIHCMIATIHTRGGLATPAGMGFLQLIEKRLACNLSPQSQCDNETIFAYVIDNLLPASSDINATTLCVRAIREWQQRDRSNNLPSLKRWLALLGVLCTREEYGSVAEVWRSLEYFLTEDTCGYENQISLLSAVVGGVASADTFDFRLQCAQKLLDFNSAPRRFPLIACKWFELLAQAVTAFYADHIFARASLQRIIDYSTKEEHNLSEAVLLNRMIVVLTNVLPHTHDETTHELACYAFHCVLFATCHGGVMDVKFRQIYREHVTFIPPIFASMSMFPDNYKIQASGCATLALALGNLRDEHLGTSIDNNIVQSGTYLTIAAMCRPRDREFRDIVLHLGLMCLAQLMDAKAISEPTDLRFGENLRVAFIDSLKTLSASSRSAISAALPGLCMNWMDLAGNRIKFDLLRLFAVLQRSGASFTQNDLTGAKDLIDLREPLQSQGRVMWCKITLSMLNSRAGDVDTLVGELQESVPADDTDVAISCLEALKTLLGGSRSDGTISRGLQIVAELMRVHEKVIRVQVLGCEVISFYSCCIQRAAAYLDCVKPVVEHSESAATLSALHALCTIALADASAKEFGQLRVLAILKIVCAAMERHVVDSTLQLAGYRALTLLLPRCAGAKGGWKWKAGSINAVVGGMYAHAADEEIQRHALRLLNRDLSSLMDTLKTDITVCQHLIQIITAFGGDLDMLNGALCCVTTLSKSTVLRARFFEVGAVRTIATRVDAFAENAQIANNCARAILAITS